MQCICGWNNSPLLILTEAKDKSPWISVKFSYKIWATVLLKHLTWTKVIFTHEYECTLLKIQENRQSPFGVIQMLKKKSKRHLNTTKGREWHKYFRQFWIHLDTKKCSQIWTEGETDRCLRKSVDPTKQAQLLKYLRFWIQLSLNRQKWRN